jgi:hypothetical protein
MTEYVRISGAENLYGQKNILHGELDVLNLVKRIRNYKTLRKEELVLRLALKKRIGEVVEDLKVLSKLLPHAHIPELDRKLNKKSKEELADEKLGLTLEQELEQIRRRLVKLDG